MAVNVSGAKTPSAQREAMQVLHWAGQDVIFHFVCFFLQFSIFVFFKDSR